MVKDYRRPHVELLLELVTNNPNMRIVAMTGPRQVGKTTIAIQACQKLDKSGILYWHIPLDDPHSVMIRPSNIEDAAPPPKIGARPDGETLIKLWEQARLSSLRSKRGLFFSWTKFN